jgi:hypothetical protein
LEWDIIIAPGSSIGITKDKFLQVQVPEPSAMALVCIGLLGLALRRRNQ